VERITCVLVAVVRHAGRTTAAVAEDVIEQHAPARCRELRRRFQRVENTQR
jgi:hypothetical protein